METKSILVPREHISSGNKIHHIKNQVRGVINTLGLLIFRRKCGADYSYGDAKARRRSTSIPFNNGPALIANGNRAGRH